MDVSTTSHKTLTLFCSYMLIMAVIIWSGGTVSAETEAERNQRITNGDINFMTEIFQKAIYNPTASGSDDTRAEFNKNLKLYFTEEDGKQWVEIRTSLVDTTGSNINGTRVTVDYLVDLFKEPSPYTRGFSSYSDGVLTVTSEGKMFKIPLEKLPSHVESIEITDNGHVMYGASVGDDGSGVITIQDSEAYLSKGEGDTTVITHGQKTFTASVGNEGTITYNKNLITFEGTGTTLNDGTNSFSPIDGQKGSLSYNPQKEGEFTIQNSLLSNPSFGIKGLTVGDAGLYIGDVANAPNALKTRTLSFVPKQGNTGPRLTGNLQGLVAGEEVVFSNKLSDDTIVIDKSVVGGTTDTNLPKGQEAVFENKDNAVTVTVRTDSGATSSHDLGGDPNADTGNTDNKSGNRPPIPIAGTINANNNSGGTTNNNSGNKIPGNDLCPPGNNGCPPGSNSNSGGLFGGSWWLWALLIGGGVLAAMYFFGDDEEGPSKSNDAIDDGGSEYLGRDDTQNVFGNVTDGRDPADKTTTYNPTEPVSNTQCECNASGCFYCPEGNCLACDPSYDPSNASDDSSDDSNNSS